MNAEPDPSFITSLVELKLDPKTLFEWQKHSQSIVDEVRHYNDVLEFLNMKAQASEVLSASNPSKKQTLTSGKKLGQSGKVAFFAAANADSDHNYCIICTSERHLLYACPKFSVMSHNVKLSTFEAEQPLFQLLFHGSFL